MTEPLPPLTDEDLSTVLDGEARPDVVARVQADPAARARVDAFRAAGDALRQTPVDPLDAATVEDLIASALATAAADGTSDRGTADRGTAAVVLPLAPRRSNSGASRWLVAAAVIALVAVGLGLVWSGVSKDGDSNLAQKTGAGKGGAVSEQTDRGTGGADADANSKDGSVGEPSGTAPTTTGGGLPESLPVPNLGDFASFDTLRTALKTTFPTSAVAPRADAPTQDQIDRCDTQMRQVFEISSAPLNTGIASVDDQDVIVFEYDRASFGDGRPTTFVTAVTPADCASKLSFERTPG